MHFYSLPRKLHGVDRNGLSLETPEYGIINYNHWIDSVSRYLRHFSASIVWALIWIIACLVGRGVSGVVGNWVKLIDRWSTHSSDAPTHREPVKIFSHNIPVPADSLTQQVEVERTPRFDSFFSYACKLLSADLRLYRFFSLSLRHCVALDYSRYVQLRCRLLNFFCSFRFAGVRSCMWPKISAPNQTRTDCVGSFASGWLQLSLSWEFSPHVR